MAERFADEGAADIVVRAERAEAEVDALATELADARHEANRAEAQRDQLLAAVAPLHDPRFSEALTDEEPWAEEALRELVALADRISSEGGER